MTRKQLLVFVPMFFVAVLLGSSAFSQDALKVAPDMHKLLLENDEVRVYEVFAKPGQKIASHSHPDHVVYFLTPGKATFVGADGKSVSLEFKAGQATFVKATTHTVENTGTADFRAVIVEMTEEMKHK